MASTTHPSDDPLPSLVWALHTMYGWAAVVAGTLLLGFLGGYWLGYAVSDQGFPGLSRTFQAFVLIPFLWLGDGNFFIAYAVTCLAWYLPLRYDSPWLKVGAAVTNLGVWCVVIELLVARSANGKFFHY